MKQTQKGSGRGFDSRLVHHKEISMDNDYSTLVGFIVVIIVFALVLL